MCLSLSPTLLEPGAHSFGLGLTAGEPHRPSSLHAYSTWITDTEIHTRPCLAC